MKNILVITSYYPNEDNPLAGIFVQEYNKAASIFTELKVIYAKLCPSPNPLKYLRKTESMESGIDTIRICYGGTISYIYQKTKLHISYLINIIRTQETFGLKDKQANSLNGTGKNNRFTVYIKKILHLFRYISYCTSIVIISMSVIKKGWSPDVIHAHGYSAGIAAVCLGKILDLPVLVTEHSSNIMLGNLSLEERLKLSFCMNRVTYALPVSKILEKAIFKYSQPRNTAIIPNTVDADTFYFAPQHKSGEYTKSILTVSNLKPLKGIDDLINAAAELARNRCDFKIDIVGEGICRNVLERMVGNLGLNNTIQFHGQINKQAVAQMMRNCDFLVHPSPYETFGVVIIEALACGKPVILTKQQPLSGIIDDSFGITVRSREVKELQNAMNNMLDMHTEYDSQKITDFARKYFSHEAVGKMLTEIYDDAIRKANNDHISRSCE